MSTKVDALSTLQKAEKALLSILERAEKQEATAAEIRILPSVAKELCMVVYRISKLN
jgi:hypothetical protein